jgi:hypothetical protein
VRFFKQKHLKMPMNNAQIELHCEYMFAWIQAKPEHLIRDKAYGSNKLDQSLAQEGIEAIASNKANRKMRTQEDRLLHRSMHGAG